AGRGVIVHHDPVVKHRTAAPATNGGTRRNRGGQGQNGVNAAAAPQQPAPAGGGTHVITEGAKSALAKIAASTIAPVLTDSGVPLEI
ncbi:hypothetical protein, partial [Enterococcus faecalis]